MFPSFSLPLVGQPFVQVRLPLHCPGPVQVQQLCLVVVERERKNGCHWLIAAWEELVNKTKHYPARHSPYLLLASCKSPQQLHACHLLIVIVCEKRDPLSLSLSLSLFLPLFAHHVFSPTESWHRKHNRCKCSTSTIIPLSVFPKITRRKLSAMCYKYYRSGASERAN